MRVSHGGACIYLPGALSSCSDLVKNGNEKDVDCGGPNCGPCASTASVSIVTAAVGGGIAAVVCVGVGLFVRHWYRKKNSTVVPFGSKHAAGPRRVSLVDANVRKMTLGQAHSHGQLADKSPKVMPVVMDWTLYEQTSGKPSSHN
jgi:hypothetical protein